MSKYEPLAGFLARSGSDQIEITFDELESIIGFKLPDSALKHRAWWSNNPSNSVMTKAWLDAGYESSAVSLALRKLVFRRKDQKNNEATMERNSDESGADANPDSEGARGYVLFGCLKGTITIKMDFDITTPADPDWAASIQ